MVAKHVALGYGFGCLVIFLVFSVYKGDSIYENAIWNSLSDAARSVARGAGPVGGISAIGWSTLKGLSYPIMAIISGVGSYYIFPLLMIYPVVSCIRAGMVAEGYVRIFLDPRMVSNYLMVVLTFFPLFVLGWDWGRWIVGVFLVFSSLVIFDLLIPCESLLEWLKNSA